MTQQDLDFLKKYLDIKVAHCYISDIQAQDIYDMMRIICMEEPITEEELDRLANEYVNERYRGYVPITEVFKAGYRKAKGE